MTPDQLATALIATAGTEGRPVDPPSPDDFGGGAPGGLGEMGRAVHAQWAAALAARAAEDTGQRARLAATAESLRTATDRYSTTDTLDG